MVFCAGSSQWALGQQRRAFLLVYRKNDIQLSVILHSWHGMRRFDLLLTT